MSLTKYKILIVEDEAPLLGILMKKFQGAGFGVVSARDGLAGLAATEKERPNLILLDIIMPRLDGISMLKKLQSRNLINGTSVIILTNLNDPVKNMEAEEYGAKDILIKSDWKLEDIIGKVRQYLPK